MTGFTDVVFLTLRGEVPQMAA